MNISSKHCKPGATIYIDYVTVRIKLTIQNSQNILNSRPDGFPVMILVSMTCFLSHDKHVVAEFFNLPCIVFTRASSSPL